MEENKQLRILQNIEYEALSEIKNICDENHITFFLRGGSVLGAVKYNGFVPWDDDIDITFPRNDYLKLINIMPANFGEKFQFVCYQKVQNAHCYFPRILLQEEYRTRLALPRNNERGLVLIDILPLDGMPNNKIRIKWHIIKAYIYRILASLWTLEVKETVSMHSRKKQQFLKLVHATQIHHLYKQDSIYRQLDKMYAKYSFGETKMAGILASSKLKKEIVPMEWFGTGTIAKFRDLKILIPKEYDSYLKQLFGDNYASYEPPVEQHIKSHLTGMVE